MRRTKPPTDWVVVVVYTAIVVAICVVLFGIGAAIRHNAVVTCDHWEDLLERPTRLDTWGPGCVVELDDGTELPVHQVHEFQERDPR